MPANIDNFIPAGKLRLSLSCVSTSNPIVSFKTNHDCAVRMLYLMSEYPTSVSVEARDKDKEVLAFFIEDITQDDLKFQNESYFLKDEAVDRIMSKLTESME